MKKIFEISWDERKGYHELSSAAVQGMLTDEVHCGKCWNIQVKELSTKKIEKLNLWSPSTDHGYLIDKVNELIQWQNEQENK